MQLVKNQQTYATLVTILLLATSCDTAPISSDQSMVQHDDVRLLSLEIIGGISTCADEWSTPEYYATAEREDPVVEQEMDAIGGELRPLMTKIRSLTYVTKHLEQRESNTVPPTSAEADLLASSLHQVVLLRNELKDNREQMMPEHVKESEARLTKLLLDTTELKNRLPLSEDESRLLQQHRVELKSLEIRRSELNSRRRELVRRIHMSTPGTLRVYPEDNLRIRLMEEDRTIDDTCQTWELVLDDKTLDSGGIDLENAGEKVLRVRIRRE